MAAAPVFANLTPEKWMSHFGEWFVPITETGCWIWMRGTSGPGYGSVPIGGRKFLAHRLSYEFLRGPIPEGLTIDHLCRTPSCVNPDHLEPVTNRENVLRGVGITARHARKTHCQNGHEFTPDNTYAMANGGRMCRTCKAEWSKRWIELGDNKRKRLEGNRRWRARQATQ